MVVLLPVAPRRAIRGKGGRGCGSGSPLFGGLKGSHPSSRFLLYFFVFIFYFLFLGHKSFLSAFYCRDDRFIVFLEKVVSRGISVRPVVFFVGVGDLDVLDLLDILDRLEIY